MKAPHIPLEFDILCQGEEAKRVLKIGQYDRTTSPSGSAGSELSIKKDGSYSSSPLAAERFTIKESLLRLGSIAFELRQKADRTRAQSQPAKICSPPSWPAKRDCLAAVERIEALRRAGGLLPLVHVRHQHRT